ncbi:MAG: RNA polymerase sigma factor [Planctomycetaceae bacterium]
MNEADQHLLTLIQSGDHDGWIQFVARYQKRLMAFALRQVDQAATAEDVVQETFVGFLNAMASFRQQCELESFLFQILRRRIVDHYRRQGRSCEVSACALQPSATDPMDEALRQPAAQDMHASWYVRRDEANEADRQTLSTAIHRLADKLQSAEKLRDLKIAEGLFYAGLRNQELATALNCSESEISLVKHRLLKRLTQLVRDGSAEPPNSDCAAESPSDLLTSVWEDQRPTCPKRSTLGKFILGLLPADWHDFVDFHVNILACRFCEANLEELRTPEESLDDKTRNDRLFHSTVGFLKRS